MHVSWYKEIRKELFSLSYWDSVHNLIPEMTTYQKYFDIMHGTIKKEDLTYLDFTECLG